MSNIRDEVEEPLDLTCPLPANSCSFCSNISNSAERILNYFFVGGSGKLPTREEVEGLAKIANISPAYAKKWCFCACNGCPVMKKRILEEFELPVLQFTSGLKNPELETSKSNDQVPQNAKTNRDTTRLFTQLHHFERKRLSRLPLPAARRVPSSVSRERFSRRSSFNRFDERNDVSWINSITSTNNRSLPSCLLEDVTKEKGLGKDLSLLSLQQARRTPLQFSVVKYSGRSSFSRFNKGNGGSGKNRFTAINRISRPSCLSDAETREEGLKKSCFSPPLPAAVSPEEYSRRSSYSRIYEGNDISRLNTLFREFIPKAHEGNGGSKISPFCYEFIPKAHEGNCGSEKSPFCSEFIPKAHEGNGVSNINTSFYEFIPKAHEGFVMTSESD